MIDGADVSQFSGLLADYSALSPRCVFAIPRICSGLDTVDALAESHRRGFEGASIEVLAGYGFVKSYRDGAHQAEFARQVALDFDLPLFADFEPVARGPQPTDAPHLARVTAIAFLRRYAELAGRPCGVYGPASYLAALNLPSELCGPLWSAHVGLKGKPRDEPPWPVPDLPSYAIHQFQHNADAGLAMGARPSDVHPARAVVDWNRSPHTLADLRAMLGGPLPFAALGPVVTAVRQAEGRGERVEDFEDTDPGVR